MKAGGGYVLAVEVRGHAPSQMGACK